MRTPILATDKLLIAYQWEFATVYKTDDGYPCTYGADCVILERGDKKYALPNLKFYDEGYSEECDDYYFAYYKKTYDANEMLEKIKAIGTVDLAKWMEIEDDNQTLEEKWDEYAQIEMEERAYWMGR